MAEENSCGHVHQPSADSYVHHRYIFLPLLSCFYPLPMNSRLVILIIIDNNRRSTIIALQSWPYLNVITVPWSFWFCCLRPLFPQKQLQQPCKVPIFGCSDIDPYQNIQSLANLALTQIKSSGLFPVGVGKWPSGYHYWWVEKQDPAIIDGTCEFPQVLELSKHV